MKRTFKANKQTKKGYECEKFIQKKSSVALSQISENETELGGLWLTLFFKTCTQRGKQTKRKTDIYITGHRHKQFRSPFSPPPPPPRKKEKNPRREQVVQLAFLTVSHRFHCIICALNFSTSAMFHCILAVFFSVSSTFHHGSVFLCVSHIPLWQCFSLCCPHSIMAVFFSVSATSHHGNVFLCVSHIPSWQCFFSSCVSATFHHGSVFFLPVCQPHSIMAVLFFSCVSATFHYGNVFSLCVSHIPLWQCFSLCQPHFIMAVFFSVSATFHHGNVFLCISHIPSWHFCCCVCVSQPHPIMAIFCMYVCLSRIPSWQCFLWACGCVSRIPSWQCFSLSQLSGPQFFTWCRQTTHSSPTTRNMMQLSREQDFSISWA